MSEAEPPLFDRSLRRNLATMAAVGLVLAAITAVAMSVRDGLGVLVGVVVACSNLVAFAWVGRRMLAAGGTAALLVLPLKLFGLFAFVGLCLEADIVRALPFAFGYASLPLGLTIASFFEQKAADRTPEA